MATAVHPPSAPSGQMETTKDRHDARRRARLKISLPAEVRPFDARFAEIVDVAEVIDFTRDGIYFATCMPHYFVGMRILVTFPFGKKVSTHKKFLGSIVRLENRPGGSVGIAVRFVL
jgi:hypothetical protein